MKICNVTYDDALKHHPEQVFFSDQFMMHLLGVF